MGSWTGDVPEAPESVYQKATSVLASSGMKVLATIPSQSLTADGGKDVNLIILVALAVVGFLVFLIGLFNLLLLIIGLVIIAVAAVYYIIAPKNTFNVGISAIGQGSRVSINSSGSKAEGTQSQLIGILPMGDVGTGPTRVCRNCHTIVTDTSATFCSTCGGRL